jgi:hypothetical protein
MIEHGQFCINSDNNKTLSRNENAWNNGEM